MKMFLSKRKYEEYKMQTLKDTYNKKVRVTTLKRYAGITYLSFYHHVFNVTFDMTTI